MIEFKTDWVSRTKMKYIAALFLITIVYVSAHKTPVVLCGRQLADARALLCFGAENVPQNKRGSSNNNMLGKCARTMLLKMVPV